MNTAILLEDISNFAADHIDMPLHRFFALLAIGLFSLLLLVATIAPFSISRIVSIVSLFAMGMGAVFMACANYWINRLETLNQSLDDRFEEVVISADQSDSHKDPFIA